MYVGSNPQELNNSIDFRFFYGLRRTNDGELFFASNDVLDVNDSIEINTAGNAADNFDNFQEGSDFLEGRDVTHNLVYNNLKYEQFFWDNQRIYFSINDNGELVISTNVKPSYDEDSSNTQSYSETQNYLPAGYVEQGYVTNS